MSLILTDDSPPDHTVDITGTLVYKLISTQATTYTFEAEEQPGGITDYEFEIPKADAEKAGNINPGKIFIWLMKKAKEHICPQCK